MGYDKKTAERVRRILSRRRGVVEKKMVGGLSFIVGLRGIVWVNPRVRKGSWPQWERV